MSNRTNLEHLTNQLIELKLKTRLMNINQTN